MKIFAAIFTAVFLAITAQAQDATKYVALAGGTNNVASAATNTYTLTQTVSEFDNVGIQVSYKQGAITNGNLILKFAKTLDTTTYETTPSIVLTMPGDGTNTFCFVTNLSIPHAAALKLTAAEWANTHTYITNLNVTYRLKSPKRMTSN